MYYFATCLRCVFVCFGCVLCVCCVGLCWLWLCVRLPALEAYVQNASHSFYGGLGTTIFGCDSRICLSGAAKQHHQQVSSSHEFLGLMASIAMKISSG